MAATQANMADYEAERQNFQWEAPEQFNFASDVVGKWAADPKKEAMWGIGPDGQERHVTFSEFHRKSKPQPPEAQPHASARLLPSQLLERPRGQETR